MSVRYRKSPGTVFKINSETESQLLSKKSVEAVSVETRSHPTKLCSNAAPMVRRRHF